MTLVPMLFTAPRTARSLPPLVATVLVAVVLAVAAGLLGPTAAGAQGAPPTPDPLAAALVDMIDGSRAEHGLAPLGWDPALADIAVGWSATMAAEGRLHHNPGAAASYQAQWTRFAENVGAARVPGADPAAVVARLHTAFMESSGHRDNVLGQPFTAVGIGIVVDDAGKVWATVNFSDATPPVDDAPTPAPAPATHYRRAAV